MSSSPDIWTAVNGLNQQGYEGALGATATQQTQPGGYSGLLPTHNHLVSSPSPPYVLSIKIFLATKVLTMHYALFRASLHTHWWRTWTEVFHPCPPFIVIMQYLTLLQATYQKIQQVRENKISFFLWLVILTHFNNKFLYLVSGNHGGMSGTSQTGDTLGKALASVSMHHTNPY